jgi:hypothetical protein
MGVFENPEQFWRYRFTLLNRLCHRFSWKRALVDFQLFENVLYVHDVCVPSR